MIFEWLQRFGSGLFENIPLFLSVSSTKKPIFTKIDFRQKVQRISKRGKGLMPLVARSLKREARIRTSCTELGR